MLNWGQQRDRDARFEALVLPHLDVLHYAAVRLTRDESTAEDLVQETFLRAYRALHQLTQEESSRAWLMKIMTNIWLNQLQKRGREGMTLDIDELDLSPQESPQGGQQSLHETPDLAATRKQFCEDVDRALQQLPESFRIVVMLADVEGLSYKEIAATLQCPIGTVMSRLYRARQLLRKALWVHARRNQEDSPPDP
ncbi:MAG TPA: sigma-70 family RNA polymerase sigma factor [Candidatus Tectomicrobia bacterium]|nr:sigma-70 family RNA polymerase sigma factor [Candidatus Tectomicrobia bacterium]